MVNISELEQCQTVVMCPICKGALRRLFMQLNYWILICETCRHRCAEIETSVDHVERIYDDQYFVGGGAGYSNYEGEAQILRARGQWYGRLLARYMQPGIVLDVGTAAGFVLKELVDSGWKGTGVEPNPRMAEYAREHLNLYVETGTLERLPNSDGRLYDLITMIQVIAHFLDPRGALQAASEITRPGGFLLVETWNRESWTARAFGKHWHEYSPPSVLHWFSPEGLSRLTAQFGFREVAHGRPAKWIGGAHAKSLLRYRLEDSRVGRLMAGMVSRIPDELSIPYPAEDLFWALFQKSQ